MMKKKFILFMCFFLLAVLVSADESIYNGWVEEKSTIDSKGYVFDVSTNSRSVIFEYDDNSVIVKNSSCEEYNNLDFCVETIEEDVWNVTFDRYEYKADVSITAYSGNMKITRSFDETNPDIGRQFRIDMTLENDGNVPATNVEYIDSFPGFDIVSISKGDCYTFGDSIMWRGTIADKDDVKCTYYLKVLEPIEYGSRATLSYFDGVSKQNIESDKITIKVDEYTLELDSELDKTKIGVGEKVNLIAKLSNTEEYVGKDISLMKIDIGDCFISAEEDEKFLKRGRSGSLYYKDPWEYDLDLTASKGGECKISVVVDFVHENFRRQLKDEYVVEVVSLEPSVVFDIDRSLESGKKYQGVLNIDNPSQKQVFNDISVNVRSTARYFGGIDIEELNPKQHKTSVIDVFAPNVEKKDILYITVYTDYKTDKTRSIKKEYELEVLPVGYVEPEEVKEAVVEEEEQVVEETPAVVEEVVVEEEEIEIIELEENPFKNPLIIVVEIVLAVLVVVFLINIMNIKKKYRDL